MDKVVYEQTIAADISSEIGDEDRAVVRETLSRYLVDAVPEAMRMEGAAAFKDLKTLQVGFDCPDDSFGKGAKYSVTFVQKSSGEPWTLGDISIQGQHVLPGYDKPIFSIGALESETVAEVVEHVSRFWEKSGAGRMQISAVASNALPPLHSFPEEMGEMPGRAVYVAMVESLEPPKSYVPSIGKRSSGLGMNVASSSQSSIVWLARDEGGGLVITDVQSGDGSLEGDPQLALLRSKVEQPDDPREVERGIDAARAVLPDRARDVDPRSTVRMLQGYFEMLTVTFDEAPISDRRRAMPMVFCRRAAGTEASWRCQNYFMTIQQSVPGQQGLVSLDLVGLDENSAEEMVHRLRASLADHPSIDSAGEPTEIWSVHPEDANLKAHVKRGTGFYKVLFRYDGNVEIESVELTYRMGEDPGS